MYYSTKIIELGSCAFRQPKATSHCKYIHGYRLTAKFWFAANELDENNWVVDFGSLKELKNLLQQQFDHTTCISKHDPHLDKFIELEKTGLCDLRIMDGVGIEKFAKWCHDAADNFAGILTNLRCRCVRVEVFEHENNSAIHEQWPEYFAGATEYLEKKTDDSESVVSKATNSPENVKSEPSSEPESESESEPEEQTGLKNVHVNEKTGERRTKGSWVDPKYRGKTTNTWLF